MLSQNAWSSRWAKKAVLQTPKGLHPTFECDPCGTENYAISLKNMSIRHGIDSNWHYAARNADEAGLGMHEDVQALSERETEVLRLLLAGHDAKSVARSLDLSVHTVNDRLRDARRKLGVSSSREAARLLAESEQQRFPAAYQLAPKLFVSKKMGVVAAVSVPHTEQTEQRQAANLSIAWLAGGMLVMSLIVAAFALTHATRDGRAMPAMPAMQLPVVPPLEIDLMPIADTDGDGLVSFDEYRAFSAQGWDRVSKGEDEVRVADLGRMERLGLLGIMPNAKGTITRKMYFGAIPARFAMLDLDGDNALSADEINGLNYQP